MQHATRHGGQGSYLEAAAKSKVDVRVRVRVIVVLLLLSQVVETCCRFIIFIYLREQKIKYFVD